MWPLRRCRLCSVLLRTMCEVSGASASGNRTRRAHGSIVIHLWKEVALALGASCSADGQVPASALGQQLTSAPRNDYVSSEPVSGRLGAARYAVVVQTTAPQIRSHLVRTEGVEPSRACALRILSPVCLPVPPRPLR